MDEQEEDEFGDQLSRCCFLAGCGSTEYSYLYQDEFDHDALQRADVVLDVEDVDRYESLISAIRTTSLIISPGISGRSDRTSLGG